MEVNHGKSHSAQFECGLCEIVAKNLENLEMRLTTYEIYQCDDYEKCFKKLSEIKEHIKDEHANYIIHAKQNRADSDEIDLVGYSEHFFQANN